MWKMKAGQYLNFALLLLLSSGYGWSAITLDQPSVLAAEVGSTASLSCHLRLGKTVVDRVNLYWLLQGPNKTIAQYLYPEIRSTNTVHSYAAWINQPNHDTDMSLSIANVRLPYTGLYLCQASLMIGSKNTGVTGNGTYLFVHEQLEITVNETGVICRTKVQEVEGVQLVWTSDVRKFNSSPYRWFADSKDGYWLSNLLPNGSTECETPNVTVTCLLQYMGETLAKESTQVYCPGDPNGPELSDQQEHPRPHHLYGLVLGSSALILLILLTVWLMKYRNYRKNAAFAQYTNVSPFRKIRDV